MSSRVAIALAALAVLSSAAAADDALDRRAAMAVENVVLAQASCGHELTFRARNLILRDRRHEPPPFAADRTVLAKLWRETFACTPAYAGENCFAARWQLCQRAYGEYGPEGIRMKGLIKAIVKK